VAFKKTVGIWRFPKIAVPQIGETNGKTHGLGYPLVNIQITMENHHFQWENPLEMVIFNSYFDITRGYPCFRKPPKTSPRLLWLTVVSSVEV